MSPLLIAMSKLIQQNAKGNKNELIFLKLLISLKRENKTSLKEEYSHDQMNMTKFCEHDQLFNNN